AVDHHRLVADQLARLGAGRAEAHPVDDVVQAALEQLEQVLAGVALATLGLGEIAPELALEHAVHPLDLLLLAKLDPVVGRARARGASVLARLAVELALGVEPPAGALQEKVGPFAAGQLGFRSGITCHVFSPSNYANRLAVSPSSVTRPGRPCG